MVTFLEHRILQTLMALLCCLLVVVAPPQAHGFRGDPKITVEAEANPARVSVGENFLYVVKINGNADARLETPQFFKTPGLRMLGNPSQSTSFQNIYGQTSVSVSYTYTLQATQLGEFTIPPARAFVGSQSFNSNPVTVRVTEVPRETIGDMQIVSGTSTLAQVNNQLKGRYFVKAEVPSRAYVGQVVPLVTYIYRARTLQAARVIQKQSADPGSAFVRIGPTPPPSDPNRPQPNDDPDAQSLVWESVEVDGTPFLRARLSVDYFLPIQTGEHVLTGPSFTAHHAVRGNSDMMFFPMENTIAVLLRLIGRTVEVLEPPAPKPGSIFQLIGAPRVVTTVDRRELSQFELVTVTLRIEGVGYFETIPQPKLPEIPGLKLVDSRAQGRTREEDGQLRSQRIFEYVFQADRPGGITIPPLPYAIYDPERGLATALETPQLDLVVKATAASAPVVADAARRTSPEAPVAEDQRATATRKGSDVAWIDRTPIGAGDSRVGDMPLIYHGWFWVAQGLPISLALGAGFFVARARATDARSLPALRRRWRRQADDLLRRTLDPKRQLEREEFYRLLAQALLNACAASLGRAPAGITAEAASSELVAVGCGEEIARRVRRFLEFADQVRYAPVPDSAERRNADLTEARALLAELGSIAVREDAA